MTYANLAGLLANVAAIPTSGVTVKGLTGSGNDFMVGGGGVDVLFGGDGNDTIYGGNFLSTGDTETIEEDGNDFIDAGRGDDTVYADDSMGREEIRDTGIAIKSAIFFDENLNGLRDANETGFGGVTVKLYRQSDSQLVATVATDVDGSFAFNGLDPLNYYMTFSIPTGLSLVTKYAGGATHPDDSATDSDAAISGVVGKTDQFHVGYGETKSSVTAGFTGPAQVSIADQSVNEGSSGQTAVNFTITLSHIQGFAVEVEYKTVNGDATASSGDFQAVPNTVLTFAPGETSKTITINVNGDTMYEPNEQFQLSIVRAQRMDPSGPVNLATNGAPATVTIVNDDPIPTISIHDYRQMGVDDDNDPLTPPVYDEDAPGSFLVTLSNPSQFTITVNWRTDVSLTFQGANPEDAATPFGFPNPDFIMNDGMLTFQPGETQQEIKIRPSGSPAVPNSIVVLDDSLDETDETFFVDLFNPTFADIADDRAYGIIMDDDNPVSAYIVPTVPIDPVNDPFTTEVTEGNIWVTPVSFWIKLSSDSGKTVTVTWATSPGTAVESVFSGSSDPVDYVGAPNSATPDETTVVFQPHETQKKITVYVIGDTTAEGFVNPDDPSQKIEQFFVNIISVDNGEAAADPASGQTNHSTVNIVDDDVATTDAGPWSVYFDSTTFTHQEPNGFDDYAYITVRRTPGSSDPVAVFYTTQGTATAGADYDEVFRYLVYFAGNSTVQTVPIKIHHDSTVEGPETVNLWLKNPTGGPVRATPDHAVLRIVDGNAPDVKFDSTTLTVTEGSGGGTTAHNITVRLYDSDGNLLTAGDQQSTITVNYSLVDSHRAPSR